MMTFERQQEVATQFGFATVDEMLAWGCSLNGSDYHYDGTDALITDGDDGIMLIRGYSDVDQWEGVKLCPVHGAWTEFHIGDLMQILKTLKARLEIDETEFNEEMENV
jgi:hypothetical protein